MLYSREPPVSDNADGGERLLATTAPVCRDGGWCAKIHRRLGDVFLRVKDHLVAVRHVEGLQVERGTSVRVPIVLRRMPRPVRGIASRWSSRSRSEVRALVVEVVILGSRCRPPVRCAFTAHGPSRKWRL